MASTSRKSTNGRAPLVNQQRQITSFFAKKLSASPSPSLPPTSATILSKIQKPKLNPPNSNPSPPESPSSSPTTPSPVHPKPRKPLLVIGETPLSYGEEVVGKRVRVYWPMDKAWYEGCVLSFDSVSGKHLVKYDDSEEEELELGKETIEWVEEEKENGGRKFKRLRKGGLGFSSLTVEDEKMEDVEEDNGSGGEDSGDEDWEKNGENEASEDGEEEEDFELEDEEVESRGKRDGKAQSRKRKASGRGKKLVSGKKCRSGEEGLKVSVVGPSKERGK